MCSRARQSLHPALPLHVFKADNFFPTAMAAMSVHCAAATGIIPVASGEARDHYGREGSSGQTAVRYQSTFLHLDSASHKLFTKRCRLKVTAEKRRAPSGTKSQSAVLVKGSYGRCSVQGSGRAVMEDSIAVEEDPSGSTFFAVFDGHGGKEVSDFLQKALWPAYKKQLEVLNPIRATVKAFEEVDELTMAPPKGLFGALRQRGMGGPKCGSTAATLVVRKGEPPSLLAANVGDSRIVLSRGGTAVQLSIDHKPDVESERRRIESKNPTPKKPLVQKVEGIWRVGGLLALSRAFGDVYLKDWSDGVKDGARGGFGLTAEPSVTVEDVQPDDTFVVLGSDGLFDFVPNQAVVDMCEKSSYSNLDELAKKLVEAAVAAGSTDDISAIVVRLP